MAAIRFGPSFVPSRESPSAEISPATVIGESPDEPSNQAIRAALFGEPAPPVPSAEPRLFEPE
jgi:hypothetical protein